MSAPRIHLSIDRLALHGFAPEQHDALVAALQWHLREALAANAGALAPTSSRASVAAPAPGARAEGSIASVATDAAQRIVQGIVS